MIRKIIKIDENKCNGCELCVSSCHEGAIGMKNTKAVLLRDDYCDGLGDCLPICPVNAISFEEREADEYNIVAVKNHIKLKKVETVSYGCHSSNTKNIEKNNMGKVDSDCKIISNLIQWPVQIKLIPVNAPYFDNSSLLIAADCTAYAYGDFHRKFMRNKITLIGCPKLDNIEYKEKLAQIIKSNEIRDITVIRMEVPCCKGVVNAVIDALKQSEKTIPCSVVTITTDGKILNKE